MEGSPLGEAGGEGEATGATEWARHADSDRKLAGPGAQRPVRSWHWERTTGQPCVGTYFPTLLTAETFVHKRCCYTSTKDLVKYMSY